MKLSELLIIIQDEKKSEDYLRSVGILKTFSNCPRCNGTNPGMIRGDRWKCYKCKTEWTRRKDSILSLVRIKYSEFLLCLKLFEVELTAEEVSAQLNINYKTVKELYRLFRIAMGGNKVISAKVMKGTLRKTSEKIGINLIDNKYYFDLENAGQTNIAVIEMNRSRISTSAAVYEASIKIIQTTRVKTLFDLPPSFQRFVRFTKEKLFKFRGTDRQFLNLYLKEIEFRFNHQEVDIYGCLEQLISSKF
jgi:transposase